jgi:tetratricopeptide (TPR) repeat protein
MFWKLTPQFYANAAMILLLCCLIPFSMHGQTLPDLPKISVDNFAPEIQQQIRKADETAKAQPRDAAANGQLGMVLHTYNQYEFATLCYLRATHLAPQEFRWHYYLGLAHSALGKHTEAIQALQQALRLRPDAVPAKLRIADAMLAARQYSGSQSLYESLAKNAETSAQAQYGLGQIKSATGDKTSAMAHYRQAITVLPEYGMAHYALGLLLREQDAPQAKQHLALSQQYKQQRPFLKDPWLEAIAELNLSATSELQRGVVLAGMDKLADSIAAHEHALAMNSRLVQAHINLISLHARLGQFDKAEKHYREVIAINPNLADSHFNYGIVLMNLERYREAAEAFQRSLECNPFSADAHYNYAIIIERDGRLNEAAEHYRQALASNPVHRLSHFHYARILVHQGKLPEAIEHLHSTLTAEDEDTPRFMYALGATYARAGDREKAINYLREALKRAVALNQKEVTDAITRDLQRLEGRE